MTADANGKAPRAATADLARARSAARGYLGGFVAGALSAVAFFYGTLALLLALDRLPPPPVSGTWCIDSRFAWLKGAPQWRTASFTAVGSSTTWRNLNFSVAPEELAGRGIVNAAPCFLTINQTRYLAEYLLERAPSTKTLLTVVTLRDLEGCSRNPTAFFDPKVADDYLEGKSYPWWLYFRNFRFKDILFHALYAGERRPQMQYDRFGSGPLTRQNSETGHAFAPEAACYAELRQLATMLGTRGVQFIVVTFPVMQSWAQRYDATGHARASFRTGVEKALASTRAILVDGMADWHVPDSAFTDPVHLQWPQTAAFTRFVLTAASHAGASLPPLDQNDAGRSIRRVALTRAGPAIALPSASMTPGLGK